MVDTENLHQGGAWPDWLAALDLKLADTLASMGSAHERLRASVAAGYDYQLVLQAKLNAVTDQMVKEGVMSRDSHDSPMGPTKRLLKPIVPNAALVAAQTAQNSASYRILGTLSYTCRLAVTKLLDGHRQGILIGDMLVPMVCIRGAIEHIAHYHAVIHKLRPYTVPVTFEDGNRTLMEIFTLLIKSNYGTRIDWKHLLTADIDKPLDAESLKYKREENRADRESKSIMSAIDLLGKTVKGTRAVYDVLCEFSHPNVGNLLLFTESAGPATDAHGVHCVKKHLSPQVPSGFLQEAVPVVCRIYEQAELCLRHLESLLEEGTKEREKVLKITQVVVSRLVSRNRSAFDAYATCPCGSGKKVKFCCGH
jgi:hypothetical protein